MKIIFSLSQKLTFSSHDRVKVRKSYTKLTHTETAHCSILFLVVQTEDNGAMMRPIYNPKSS